MAGAIAGHLKHRRLSPAAGVQTRLEGITLLALIGTLLLQPLGHPAASPLQGMLLGLAGTLTWARLIRWRLWHCLDRPDLLALASGYAWLGIGLLGLGIAKLDAAVPSSVGVHSITRGALGNLTLTVMARTRRLYRFRDANAVTGTHFTAVLMSAATLARVSVDLPVLQVPFSLALAIAAASWSLACLGTLPALLASVVIARHGRHGYRVG